MASASRLVWFIVGGASSSPNSFSDGQMPINPVTLMKTRSSASRKHSTASHGPASVQQIFEEKKFETLSSVAISWKRWVELPKGSHPSKNTGILWNNFTNGRGGSTGFHISYSEIVIIPKFVENLKKDFIKAVRGGGVTVLWKYFIKFRYFLKDGFPN